MNWYKLNDDKTVEQLPMIIENWKPDLAIKYKVSQATISNIKNNKNWCHL